MNYTLVLNFDNQSNAQLWAEETFDLSVVLIVGIVQSAFRSQHIVRLTYNGNPETPYVAAFEAGLNRLQSVWPEEKRILSWWTKDSEARA